RFMAKGDKKSALKPVCRAAVSRGCMAQKSPGDYEQSRGFLIKRRRVALSTARLRSFQVEVEPRALQSGTARAPLPMTGATLRQAFSRSGCAARPRSGHQRAALASAEVLRHLHPL